jgi:glycosyltransferase involved in cell wall biosynthesis
LRRSVLLYELKREAALLWTETPYAQNEMAKALKIPKDKIAIIGNTYGPAYGKMSISDRQRSGGRPFTFLYLTADYPHKNLDIFNKLLPLLKERGLNCRFRLTLPHDVFQKRFPDWQNDPMLQNIGPIAPNDGPLAYRDADALFFPSLIETFSANYPEAMISERPILTSDLPFAHDICMDAALYFDPFDAQSAAAAISTLVNDPALYESLVAKGTIRVQQFDSAAKRTEKLLNMMKDYLVSNR